MTQQEKIAQIKSKVEDTRHGKPIHEMSPYYLEAIFQLLCVLAEDPLVEKSKTAQQPSKNYQLSQIGIPVPTKR